MPDEADRAKRTGRARGVAGAFVGLHVAGFAASSWLLEKCARWLPGFETSRLAEQLARAGSEAATGTGGAVEWASLVLREAVVPATGEEILFRGLLYAALQRAGGPPAAIVGSACAFGFAHGDLHHGLVAGLLGISLGCLRARHGLATAWLAHAANNALAFAAPAAPVPTALDGGLPGLAIALALAGISNAVLWQALRSGPDARRAGLPIASGDEDV